MKWPQKAKKSGSDLLNRYGFFVDLFIICCTSLTPNQSLKGNLSLTSQNTWKLLKAVTLLSSHGIWWLTCLQTELTLARPSSPTNKQTGLKTKVAAQLCRTIGKHLNSAFVIHYMYAAHVWSSTILPHVSGSRITGVLGKTLESGRDRLKVSLHTTIVEVGGVINKGVGHGIFWNAHPSSYWDSFLVSL